MRLSKNLALFVAASLLHSATHAGSLSLTTTAAQVGLLELYTSEGCSSCPPADRWLRNLEDDPRLWREFLPVAFHVDYWDYIGWKDRFASPAYSERQRNYAREQSLTTVYTPGFIYNGREWRQWFSRRTADFPKGGHPGVLTLNIEDFMAMVRFTPTTLGANTSLRANLVLLGFGLSTQVKAGENKGRELRHSFVVLGMRQVPMTHADGIYSASIPVPESIGDPQRLAVASWIDQEDHQRPIQAVGGWLP